MIAIERISKRFGGLKAIDGFSAVLPAGIISAVIGANGAGKSTLLNLISGTIFPDFGDVKLNGVRVTTLPATLRARMGIGRLWQDARPFVNMSVLDNLLVACSRSGGRTKNPRKRALELLDQWELRDFAKAPASVLSGGQRKIVGILRVLIGDGSHLLLDEPTAALSPGPMNAFADTLRNLAARGRTIVLVEHDFDFVNSVADHVYVLDHGRNVDEGAPQQVLTNLLT